MSNPKRTVVSGEAEVQTPDEKFEAIRNLTQKIEEKFIELGNVLSNIKRAKLFRFKGYERFKDFIEAEYAFSSSLANKLVRVYESFVEEMDQDEETLKEVGFDKLCSVLPMMKDATWEEREEWLKKAQELPVADLKESIKSARKEAAEDALDLKKVLVEQWKEQMCNLFNCSWVEAQFKLALWFSNGDRSDVAVLSLLKQEVREAQAKFEREVTNADR